jgi:hypothetical protein
MATRRLEEWERDLINAVPDSVLKGLVGDARAHNVILSRGGTAKDNKEPSRGTGWVDAPSTSKWQAGSGIDAVDRLCDAQDRLDKLELVKKLTEAAALQRALNQTETEAQKLEEKGSQK